MEIGDILTCTRKERREGNLVYTVTFSPAVDYVVYLDEVVPGETNRSQRETYYWGGKGINVSILLSRLGVQNTALGFVAGFTGEALEQGLRREGIDTQFIHLREGISRINLKIKAARETEINAQGPAIPAEAVGKLFSQLQTLQAGDTLVLAGNIPRSLPDDMYERILQSLQGRDIRVVVDATRELLRNALSYRPFLIKPNQRELGDMFGITLETEQEIAAHAVKLQQEGARNVLVSLGKRGALLAAATGEIFTMPALGGKPKYTVGAGDSMVAGFLKGYLQSGDYLTALRWGSAAGGATACSDELGTKAEIEALYQASLTTGEE